MFSTGVGACRTEVTAVEYRSCAQMANVRLEFWKKNTFYTEPGCPAIYVNPAVKDCDADLKKIGNVIDGPKQMVEMPQLSFNPPPPTLNATRGSFNIIAVTDTPGSSLRFTLDGSRPTENSKVMPKDGINLPWPGPPATHVNVRAFKSGMLSSITNGALVSTSFDVYDFK